MQSCPLRSGTVARWLSAGVGFGLVLAAGAQNYRPYQDATNYSRKLQEDTKAAIALHNYGTQQAIAAAQRRGQSRWHVDGFDFSAFGPQSDNTYVPSSVATRPMSRAAPPPAGAEWIAKAQQAWRDGLDSDAAQYLRRASDAGSAGATRMLGAFHAEGLGVPRDAGTALALYRRAATMGDTEALLHLGRAYALGLGTPVDLREALDWYTKASRRSSTREKGEVGVEAVRVLARLEVQLAAIERCEKTGACDPEPATRAVPSAGAAPSDRP